jgi:hypothetical protein
MRVVGLEELIELDRTAQDKAMKFREQEQSDRRQVLESMAAPIKPVEPSSAIQQIINLIDWTKVDGEHVKITPDYGVPFTGPDAMLSALADPATIAIIKHPNPCQDTMREEA